MRITVNTALKRIFEINPYITGSPFSGTLTGIILQEDGKVGIGERVPQAKLDVYGQTHTDRLSVNTYDQPASVTIKGGPTTSTMHALEVQDADGNAALRVLNDGRTIFGKGDYLATNLSSLVESVRIQGSADGNPLLFLATHEWSNLGHAAEIILGDESQKIGAQYSRGIQIESPNKVNFWTPRIGINIEQPESSLDIDASAENGYSGIKIRIGNHDWRKGIQIDCSADDGVPILVRDPISGVPKFEVRGSGMVYARGMWVKLGSFPDYVFDKAYDLMPIQELSNYVRKHKHLPEVPTATEVLNDGVELGEMNKLLLKKIEELTLYLIDQDIRIKELEKAKN